MTKVLLTESHLDDIADAIRAKLGVQTTYKPGQMAAAIGSIPAGGGGATILSGTAGPASGQGDNGDLYLQTYDAPALPTGYMPAIFVKSNGYACFDTSYVYKANTVIEADVMVLSYPSPYPHVFVAWSGSATGSLYYCPAHTGLGSKVAYIFNSAEANSGKTFPRNARVKIHANRTGATWYDEQGNVIDSISISGGNSDGSVSLKLMGGGASDSYTDMRLYGCKIYEGDTLVHHYVPCKNASDVVGVYDVVAEAFLQNASSGSMTCETVSEGTIIAAYVKASGAWQDLIGSDIEDVGGVST